MATHHFVVSRSESGQTLGALLCARLSLARKEAGRLVRERRVWVAGVVCTDLNRRVSGGQRLEVREHSPTGKARSLEAAKPIIRYVDAQVVVVDKPPGLTTMRHADEAAEFGRRAQRFLPPTLADLLPPLLPRGPRLRAVHRLDKETSGLVVFARTVEAERHLGRQFRAHTIQRTYLALVRGRAVSGTITSHLVNDRGDGRRGSSSSGAGQRAVTHVRVLEELGDYSLVECRLETGRTHQVRIHLGEAGTPLCGERVYDRPLHGKPLPDGSGARRVALHAAVLGFDHPATGKFMTWSSPLPPDLQEVLTRLRRQAHPDAQ